MSLINQVLRDLDQRHAAGAALPPAVKTSAAPRAGTRHKAAAMAVTALVVLAGGAGTLAWALAVRSAPAPAPVASAAPAALPTPAPAPTPVIVVTAPPAASSPVAARAAAPGVSPAAAPMANRAAPSAPAASGPALAAASLDTSLDTSPHTPPDASPPVAPMAPAAIAAAADTPKRQHTEARIDKRAPMRTAHERAQAHYQRGAAAHQQGQVDPASAAYAAALREEAGLASARQALAGILIGQGRADDAETLLSDGLALAPQHAGMAVMLARLLAEQGHLQRAAEVLHTAAIVSPTPENRALHGAILQRLNRHADAAEQYAAALRVAPANGVWWMGLGISLAADGRNDVAREAFNRARSSPGLSPELRGYVEQRLRQLL